MNRHKQKTHDRGVKAEDYACLWLKVKGYEILERRYKTQYGEIDIIIQKGNIIAFVEVKARKTIEQALESLTPKMRLRIQNAALHYLSTHNVADYDLRFDLISIGAPSFTNWSIRHLDNAWQVEA